MFAELSEPLSEQRQHEVEFLLKRYRGYKFDLWVLSISFFLSSLSFMTAQNLMSNLGNIDLGNTAMGITYLSMALCSPFAPKFVNWIGMKRSMVLSFIFIAVFVACNIWPTWLGLIPAAVAVGAGGSIGWTAQGSYIGHISKRFAAASGALQAISDSENGMRAASDDETREEQEQTASSSFSGRFFGMFQWTQVVGNAVAYFVFRDSSDNVGKDTQEQLYTILTIVTILGAAVMWLFLRPHGTERKVARAESATIVFEQSPAQTGVGSTETSPSFRLSGRDCESYNAESSVRDLPGEPFASSFRLQDRLLSTSRGNLTQNATRSHSRRVQSTSEGSESGDVDRNEPDTRLNRQFEELLHSEGDSTEPLLLRRNQRVVSFIRASFLEFLRNNPGLKLLRSELWLFAPLFFYVGFEQGFFFGAATKAFMEPLVGERDVPLAMVIFGLFDVASSLLLGSTCTTRAKVLMYLVVGCWAHLAGLFLITSVTAFSSSPRAQNPWSAVTLVAGLWGFGDAACNTLVMALLGHVFDNQNTRSLAFSQYYFFMALGSCASFIIAPALEPPHMSGVAGTRIQLIAVTMANVLSLVALTVFMAKSERYSGS